LRALLLVASAVHFYVLHGLCRGSVSSRGAGAARPIIEERSDINTGKPWSEMDDTDLRWEVKLKDPVNRIAEFSCRTEKEVRDQAKKLGLGELPAVMAERKRKLIHGTQTPINCTSSYAPAS
jgi:hypothetical protein